jgi:hypothetical protein
MSIFFSQIKRQIIHITLLFLSSVSTSVDVSVLGLPSAMLDSPQFSKWKPGAFARLDRGPKLTGASQDDGETSAKVKLFGDHKIKVVSVNKPKLTRYFRKLNHVHMNRQSPG